MYDLSLVHRGHGPREVTDHGVWCDSWRRVTVCLASSVSLSATIWTMSKKASKSEKESATYETRDIVLGKVRGYPPWPGMVRRRVCCCCPRLRLL